jgi:hypothetical protein
MNKKTWMILIVTLMIVIFFTSGCGPQKVNLLKNPSFEEIIDGRPVGWETTAFNPVATEFKTEQGQGHSGNHYVTIINHEQNDARYCQVLPVNEFQCYKVTAWAKSENIGMQEIGANISIKEDLVNSYDIRATHHQWEYLELYIQTGKGVHSLSLTFGLGSYGSLNTGTVWLDDLRMEEVDTLPTGYVVGVGSLENYQLPTKPPLTLLLFNYGFAILLAIMVIIILILIWRDIARKRGLYFTGKIYILLAAFIVIFFKIYTIINPQLSTQVIQWSFMVLVVLTIAGALLLWKTGKWRSEIFFIILIILGIALRICYFLYTGYGVRQHDLNDVGGHVWYIQYIAQHWSLPPLGSYQLYHPPIHHIISAVLFVLGRLCGLDESFSWRLIQMGMVLLSSLALIFFYKILKQLNCGNTAKAIGVAAFAFHPAIIYPAAFLNNDHTLLFFYVMSFYFLIRWLKEHSLRNGLWLAIVTSLAILTKKTGFVLLPVILVAVFVTWFKDRSNYRTYLKQAGIFLMIVIPSAIIYPLRNYLLFHQKLNYTTLVPFDPLTSNLPTLFGFSLKNLLQSPFTLFPPYDAGLPAESFLEYLFKSSLFGEWDFPVPKMVLVLLMILALVNLINLLLLLASYGFSRNKKTGGYQYIFWFNIIFISIVVLKARLDYPYFCTQNFRYLTPILISIFYLWGESVQRLADLKRTSWKFISVTLAAAFCIVATVFILMIGVS